MRKLFTLAKKKEGRNRSEHITAVTESAEYLILLDEMKICNKFYETQFFFTSFMIKQLMRLGVNEM